MSCRRSVTVLYKTLSVRAMQPAAIVTVSEHRFAVLALEQLPIRSCALRGETLQSVAFSTQPHRRVLAAYDLSHHSTNASTLS